MGCDRTTTTRVGCFDVSVDRDHRGRYRGHQAMERNRYRGWHYHVTSTVYSQLDITCILEEWLFGLGAEVVVPSRIAIGNIEHRPAYISCWKFNDMISILWISGFNFTIHIESNKLDCYARGFITKKDLVHFLRRYTKDINERLEE